MLFADGVFARSQCETRQGDVLGPLFFALGIQDVLLEASRRYKTVTIRAFVDDISLTGNDSSVGRRELADCFIFIEAQLKARGLLVNRDPGKTVLVSLHESAWAP